MRTIFQKLLVLHWILQDQNDWISSQKHLTYESVLQSFNAYLNMRLTEADKKNRKMTLLMGFAFAFPFPVFGASVHISFTFSRTILQWRSNAFTRAKSFRLLRQLINTWIQWRVSLKQEQRCWLLQGFWQRLSRCQHASLNIDKLNSIKEIYFNLAILFDRLSQQW